MKQDNPLSLYDFVLHTVDGKPLLLSAYKGKVVLIVNTASQCGWVRQMSELETLTQRYKTKELVIIAVPSNDFGGQEPLQACDLDQWFSQYQAASLIHCDRTHIRGPNQHPLFTWLEGRAGYFGKIRWNYYKFIIDPSGHFSSWFSSFTSPSSPRLCKTIDSLLPKK